MTVLQNDQSHNDSEAIIEGETVQFTDLSTGSPDTRLWDFGEGETGNEQNPTHNYVLGFYTVSLTAFNEVSSDTNVSTSCSTGRPTTLL